VRAKFVATSDGFVLVAAGRTFLRHRIEAPAIQRAVGVSAVQMYRGNFLIEDDLAALPDLPECRVNADRVVFAANADGQPEMTLVLNETPSGFALSIETYDPRCNRLTLDLAATPEEHIWGGAEQMSYLRLNGRRFPMWTSEPGVGRDKDRELTRIMDAEGLAGGDYWTTNYPQPTFQSSAHYACHLDSSAWSVLDFSDAARHRVEVWEGHARLEFTTADSLPKLVSELSDRFGRAEPLPVLRPRHCHRSVGHRDATMRLVDAA
jgi:alpha-glucosidase